MVRAVAPPITATIAIAINILFLAFIEATAFMGSSEVMDLWEASGCAEGGSNHGLQVREKVVVRKDRSDLFPISLDLQGFRFEKL